MEQNRIIFDRTEYLDYLRVFAAFAIIILHVVAQNWYDTDVNGHEWNVFNCYDSIVRWGVPIFLMISGVLFLGREIPIKQIYRKYILRLLVAFFVWNFIYYLFAENTPKIQFLNLFSEDATSQIINMISGRHHMWYIPMIIGIYMCVPIIKRIAENEKTGWYFLTLFLVFSIIIPQTVILINDFGTEKMVRYVSAVNRHVSNMNMYLIMGYVGYFILGYYLNRVKLTEKQRIIIYVCGAIGFASTIMLSRFVSVRAQEQLDTYYGYFCLNVFMETVAIFTLFQYGKWKCKKIYPFIVKLSKWSFGAYLIHVLIIDLLDVYFHINTLSYEPLFSVPSISILVFILSFMVSALLNQVPGLKKYVV